MADNTVPSPAPPSARTYEQIEELADFFPPELYDLLTFQRANWNSESDSLASQFIPLTDVPRRSSRDAKLFIIGLLPPSANVTGRLLDRSATVANRSGLAQNVDVSEPPPQSSGIPASSSASAGYIVTVPGYQIQPSGGANTTGTPIQPGAVGEDMGPPVFTSHSPGEMYHIFHDAYVGVFGHEPTPTEMLFITAQSMRETSGKWPNNNPGFIGNYPKAQPGTFLNKNGAYFNTYESTSAGAAAMIRHVYGNPNTRASAQSGDVMGYMTSLAQGGYYGESVEIYYHGTAKSPKEGLFPALLKEASAGIKKAGGPSWDVSGLPTNAPDSCAFREYSVDYRNRVGWTKAALSGKASPPAFLAEQGITPKTNQAAYTASTNRFTRYSFYNDACSLSVQAPPVDPNGSPTSWAGKGSEAASKAAKDAAKAADRDLNLSELGQQLQGAQKDYILALQIAIEQMRRTPPLRMLVNPISFKVSEEKIIADGSFGRNGPGPLVEHWGEAQTKLTASGKLAGFFSLDIGGSPNGASGTSPGLTRMARNFSASYQNFLSLYLIYRNNGTIWLEDFARKDPTANNLALVGSVYIYYDNVLYIGSFDSLNVNETDDKPFSLEYDYTFTVRAKFELDRIPDPKENYGNSSLFAANFQRGQNTIPTDSATLSASGTTSRPLTDVELAYRQKLMEKTDLTGTPFSPFAAAETESSCGLSKPPEGGEFISTTLGKPKTSGPKAPPGK